jgi:hypothetical protein
MCAFSGSRTPFEGGFSDSPIGKCDCDPRGMDFFWLGGKPMLVRELPAELSCGLCSTMGEVGEYCRERRCSGSVGGWV